MRVLNALSIPDTLKWIIVYIVPCDNSYRKLEIDLQLSKLFAESFVKTVLHWRIALLNILLEKYYGILC